MYGKPKKYNKAYREPQYGRYHSNQSLEKYSGEECTLANYCSDYERAYKKDWKKEKISCNEVNTQYARNVIKSYAHKQAKNEIVASYCGLYMLNYSHEFEYRCTSSQIWFDFDDCTVSFCRNKGICCIDKCGDGSGFGWLFFLGPVFLLFLLIIVALGTMKKRRH